MAKHFSLREFQQGLSARLHKRWRMFVCGPTKPGVLYSIVDFSAFKGGEPTTLGRIPGCCWWDKNWWRTTEFW